VTVRDLDTWIPRLATLRAQERARLKGISRSRSRQIIAGAVAARADMKALNVGSVDLCPWALREGIILHYLQTMFNQSFDLPLRQGRVRRQARGACARIVQPDLTVQVSTPRHG
jgi:exopolyphosphatase/guanosine-5'-triphosphate,3'-diphosphate pyrophosphatase